jgi:uncharacterized membrane protein YbhN (UPF0104 family)
LAREIGKAPEPLANKALPARGPSRRFGLLVRIFFGALGVAFLAVAFWETWHRSRGALLPSWRHLTVGGVLVLVSLVTSANSWVALVPAPESHRALVRGYFVSKLGRYIPGFIWGAVSQVGFAARAGVPLSQASVAFPVFALTELAAGGTAAASLAIFGSHLGFAPRVAALSGLIPLAFMRRSWMVWAFEVVRRRIPRIRGSDLIPSQRRILVSYGWNVVTVAASALAFSVLMSSLQSLPSLAFGVSAFAVAWTIGYVALPFPSGVGVREAMLIATVGSSTVAAPVIAASVAHRLITMGAELVMIGASTARRPRASVPPH